MIKRVMALASTYSNPRHWWGNVRWRFPTTISELECVFVVGSPRSGTTLMQRILSVHSELFSVESETGMFSYQNLFAPNRRHFGLAPDVLASLYHECVDVVDFFQRATEILVRQNEGRRFVEKTPQHILRLPFILKHFPNSKIVHIVRDGRDCFCSSKTHPDIPQNKSAKLFARYWRDCVRACDVADSTGRLHTVKYESICDTPRETIAEMMRFLEMETEHAQLDTDSVGNDHRASLPEFQRLSKRVDASSVGRWRDELSRLEIDQFQKIAGQQLRRYQYELLATPH
ncbi:MAG: sulfotransferase [Planctomycetota bacterium]